MIIKINGQELFSNGIYEHYKKQFYKLLSVGFLHGSQGIYIVTYYKCDINGVYLSIRNEDGSPKVHQPFCTDLNRWSDEVKNEKGELVKRFTFIKQS